MRLAPPAAAALFAVALVPAPPARAERPDSTALGRSLDACVAPLVASGELSGQLVVSRGGRIVLERTWGYADRERHLPMTPTTRLNIASITKPVNQIVLVQLLLEKKLAVTDTIGRFLPGYPHGRITVGQLLNHQSGIPHRVTTEAQERKPMTAADVTAIAGRTPLEFEPGARSHYSSAGYTVLAHVMEVAAGEPWAELVRKRVIEPAGLAHTVPSAGLADPLPERAKSYMPGPHGLAEPGPKDLGFLAGAGSMWSTARDVERLAQAVIDGRFGPSVQANVVRRGGLSWSGSGDGFFCWLDYDTTSRVTVTFVGNVHDGAPAKLHAAIPKLLAGEDVAPLAPPAFTRATPKPGVLRRYEGRYDVAGNVGLPVSAHDGMLWADTWMLVPTSDSTFYSPVDYGTVAITRDSTGAVAGLDWKQDGQSFACPRTGPLGDRRIRHVAAR